jgi:hypothetical protein
MTGQSGATLVRDPYLQRITATEATVVWATAGPGAAEVRYRRTGTSSVLTGHAVTTLFTAAQTGMASDYYQHEARLTNLASGASYTYDVFVAGIDLTPSTDQLVTAPPVGTGPVSFVVFGDSGSGTANQTALANRIAAGFDAGRWDFALHTGDVVYPSGTYQLLQDRFFTVYEGWLRRRPIFLAVGNHEDYANGGRPYLDLFALPESGDYTRFPDHRERYYSFDYGPVHFIALDTQLAFMGNTRRQEQLNWLVRDLESTAQPWRVVFFHVPGYGSSEGASTVNVRYNLQPIFERYGVQLVLTGHQHSYARSTPWREAPALHAPVVHVVSGGGGAGLNDAPLGPWAAAGRKLFHYLSVRATDCRPANSCQLTMQAEDVNGTPFDTFTLPLRAQQQDAAPPSLAWVSPAFGATLSGKTARLAASAGDDQQVVKVDLRVDGDLRLVDTDPPFEWEWDTTRELNGSHALELTAFDIGGHARSSEPRTVTVNNAPPTVHLLSPAAVERAYTTMPYRIRWAAAAGSSPLKTIRVDHSSDGKIFAPLAGCSALPPSARECLWSAPSPASNRSKVRVVVTDGSGMEASVTSDTFSVQSGVPNLTVGFPNKAVTLGRGTTQLLKWSSSFGVTAAMRIELSRDGGTTWEALATDLPSSLGTFRWVVTGPLTNRAVLSVTALNTPIADVSDVPFAIAEPTLALTLPAASTTWVGNTRVQVRWASNLGAVDRFNVRLSTDGGSTFPFLLAASVAATDVAATVTVPSIATTSARVRIESLSNPAWVATSPIFRIQP